MLPPISTVDSSIMLDFSSSVSVSLSILPTLNVSIYRSNSKKLTVKLTFERYRKIGDKWTYNFPSTRSSGRYPKTVAELTLGMFKNKISFYLVLLPSSPPFLLFSLYVQFRQDQELILPLTHGNHGLENM